VAFNEQLFRACYDEGVPIPDLFHDCKYAGVVAVRQRLYQWLHAEVRCTYYRNRVSAWSKTADAQEGNWHPPSTPTIAAFLGLRNHSSVVLMAHRVEANRPSANEGVSE
jgi:hypothetical protein